jgi:hypothetical protein
MLHIWYDHGGPNWIPTLKSEVLSALPHDFLAEVTLALLNREKPDENGQKGKQVHVGIPSDYYKEEKDSRGGGEVPVKHGLVEG